MCYEGLESLEEAPANIEVLQLTHRTDAPSPTINVTWTMSADNIKNRQREFQIELSEDPDFTQGTKTKTWTHPNSPLSFSRSTIIDLDQSLKTSLKTNSLDKSWTEPLWKKVIYARVRLGDEEGNKRSTTSQKWTTAVECKGSYLNDTSLTPSTDWSCKNCPAGASCEADEPWFGVVALFGYYRIPSETIPTTFQRCLYPGACLGARNREFQKMYNDLNDTDVDLADQDLANVTEGCNKQYGFRNESRLCHTCGPNFRRSGLHECKKCPGDRSMNFWTIVLGVLLAIGVLSALVLVTIGEAGNINLSESMQKCILNYFQVAALFVNIPLRWPGPMQTFFDFQGAISTIGEHLVNPDCIATDSSAAELFYAKQLAYLLAPIFLVVTVFLLWRLYACKTGKEWSRQAVVPKKAALQEMMDENSSDEEEESRLATAAIKETSNIDSQSKDEDEVTQTNATIKDKFVVTVCVLIYLMYPTLCKQAFGLFTCLFMEGKRYLLADLEETCYEGRHVYYVIFVGIPQLIIFVAGLPIVGLYFLHRNRDNLDTMAVKVRYGIFFGGYKKERYYWEGVLIFRKVAVIIVSSFGTIMKPEMQVLMLNLILMCCYGAQQIGQPYNIVGAERRGHQILESLELLALAMLLLTLWSGLVMFVLDESSDKEEQMLHTFLSGFTVFANVMFLFLLAFVLARQVLREKRDGSSSGKGKATESSDEGRGESDKLGRRSQHSRSVVVPAPARGTGRGSLRYNVKVAVDLKKAKDKVEAHELSLAAREQQREVQRIHAKSRLANRLQSRSRVTKKEVEAVVVVEDE